MLDTFPAVLQRIRRIRPAELRCAVSPGFRKGELRVALNPLCRLHAHSPFAMARARESRALRELHHQDYCPAEAADRARRPCHTSQTLRSKAPAVPAHRGGIRPRVA